MYHVEIENSGGYIFAVESKGNKFSIDMDGKSGITPPDTLLASLGSCIGVYIRKYCEGIKLDLKGFSIKVEGELSRERPVSFREIKVLIDTKGIALDEMRKNSLLEFIKNCPVHNTLYIKPHIDVSLK